MEKDTITAISTPPGIGAVGMVRLSGSEAKYILGRVWISSNSPVEKFVTHCLIYGKIKNSSVDKGLVDNVLATWMQAPHSYTGEDVVEVFCHGGSVSTKLVLEAFLANGARMADPGEFTKRAFLNGKMDLTQAEAVSELIGASGERAYKLASEQLEGRLSKVIKNALSELKEIKAFVEATIDFPEEDIDFVEHEKISQKVDCANKKLTDLSATYQEGRLIHDGIKIAIVGKPNVGKSSLLNALLGSDRAIVHHVPGTTRDTIEEVVNIEGQIFKLVDTAGIRESSCEVENIGIERSKTKICEADLVIVVVDASHHLDEQDKIVLKETENGKRIVVLNKIDINSKVSFENSFKCSAKTGEGLQNLKKALVNFVRHDVKNEAEGVIISSLRHKKLLDGAILFLEDAKKAILKQESSEFIAFHLQEAMNSLGKITGAVTTEDVLNEIFSKFCIGK